MHEWHPFPGLSAAINLQDHELKDNICLHVLQKHWEVFFQVGLGKYSPVLAYGSDAVLKSAPPRNREAEYLLGREVMAYNRGARLQLRFIPQLVRCGTLDGVCLLSVPAQKNCPLFLKFRM